MDNTNIDNTNIDNNNIDTDNIDTDLLEKLSNINETNINDSLKTNQVDLCEDANNTSNQIIDNYMDEMDQVFDRIAKIKKQRELEGNPVNQS